MRLAPCRSTAEYDISPAYARRRAYARKRTILRAHFAAVLAELRARDTTDLHPSQQATRALLIAELERYARRGRFPHNRVCHDRRIPIFVDHHGTRCAMAHLIDSTGDTALVRRIASTRNFARIFEMADDTRLRRWLGAAGITLAEAARIQPGYESDCLRSQGQECLCRDFFDVDGVLEGTVLDVTAGTLTVGIDATHGEVSVAIGQEIIVQGTLEVGQPVLVMKFQHGALGRVLPVREDSTIEVPCRFDVPPLAKDDAITAILDHEHCTDFLAELDARWARSVCDTTEPESGCGCTTTTDAGPPLLVGAALLVALAGWRTTRRSRARA